MWRRKGAGAQVDIDEVDADRPVADADLAGSGLTNVDVLVGEHIWTTVAVNTDCFHGFGSLSLRCLHAGESAVRYDGVMVFRCLPGPRRRDRASSCYEDERQIPHLLSVCCALTNIPCIRLAAKATKPASRRMPALPRKVTIAPRESNTTPPIVAPTVMPS